MATAASTAGFSFIALYNMLFDLRSGSVAANAHVPQKLEYVVILSHMIGDILRDLENERIFVFLGEERDGVLAMYFLEGALYFSSTGGECLNVGRTILLYNSILVV
jgi:hypothetical protein